MDKRKLIQIIEKELEELKVLSEEVAEDENDISLIIGLAISKSRLLCQEFELLRELSAKNFALPTDDSSEEDEVDEDEISDISISDPELEIVNFDEPEMDEAPEPDEEDEDDLPSFAEESEEEFQDDEIILEDSEEEPEIDEDDLTDDEDQDENDIDFIEEEIEEEGLIEFGENNPENAEENEEEEELQPESNIEAAELNNDPHSGVREIYIDDTEDDDLEPIKIEPVPDVTERPVMREIPKPEELIQEKLITDEPLSKDRSLNATIGETKSTEPLLTNGSISSLRAAIGLNDRFLFIREIFSNNTDKYNSIIDQLDKLENQQQAVELLKANITLQKNETSLKFVDLLKRRFSK